jgi:predicted ABC-type ATPase
LVVNGTLRFWYAALLEFGKCKYLKAKRTIYQKRSAPFTINAACQHMNTREKSCYIIAGPNGAGKKTFAMDILPNEVACKNFINADLIAAGLSPFQPELAAIEAGKLMLKRIDACVLAGDSFAVETTLSGKSYIKKIRGWQALGYRVVLFYFSLPSCVMAEERVKYRVENGGHNIPTNVIERRYQRSVENLSEFKNIVDSWFVYDSSAGEPELIEKSDGY